MDAAVKARITSAKLAARYLATPTVREKFKDAPYLLDNPVVICEWETSTGEVTEMVQRAQHDTEVKETLVLIRREDSLSSLCALGPTLPAPKGGLSTDEIHQHSPIGHVYEALLPRKKWTITEGMRQAVWSHRVVHNNFGFALT